MLAFVVIAVALLADRVLGEPRRAHPLVLFGALASGLHRRLERSGMADSVVAGALAVVLLVIAPVALLWWLGLAAPAWLWVLAEVVGLYLAVGLRSLEEHAEAVRAPLAGGDLRSARAALAMMVSRETEALDTVGVAGAATESVLENGADAVFASLFWYMVAGLPGVLLHRLANTLDAMWGYRMPRYLRFGRAAARLDDVLNFVPARLTALSYALCGRFKMALACWRHQAAAWESPNAGPVMAAGAGALQLILGGPAPYHGTLRQRPIIGSGVSPDAAAINRAVALVRRGVVLWLAIILTGGLAWSLFMAVV